MKSIISLALSFILFATAFGSQRCRDFNQIFEALRNGNSVRAVFDYQKMKLVADGKEEQGPNAIGGMPVDHWEYFGKGVVRNDHAYIACSHTVLIAHPRYGHVSNYVRFRLFEDGQIEITAQYLKPTTFEVVMDEKFLGQIGSGASFFRS